jgi:hypothetical protein
MGKNSGRYWGAISVGLGGGDGYSISGSFLFFLFSFWVMKGLSIVGSCIF